MTFYNHIESVRSIAIDLTNGRKWRGASDKAAVFDDLDAARREYMRLSNENARLRSCLSDDADNAQQIMAENAKLREEIASFKELSQDMVIYAGKDMKRHFAKRLRKLGVPL